MFPSLSQRTVPDTLQRLPCAQLPAAEAEANGHPVRSGHPVRVAHVSLGLTLGGAEKLLVEFARHADRRRYWLSFLSLGGDGPMGRPLREAGWPVISMGFAGGLCPRLLLKLARYFRRERIEIVHTHMDRSHIYGTLAARLAGVRRVVHTRHGQSEELSARQRRLVNLIARWTDHFVCVSHDSARLAAEQGVPPRRIRTIWNGIDLNRFRLQPHPANGPVVSVARLSPEKDQQTLLRATAIAARRDPAMTVEIAGDGPCRDELQKLADRCGVSERVRFLGQIDDIPGLLSRAGLFVLPSLTEGIALTVLEAQAQGLPVVATRVGGNPEIIQHGETGVLVPPADAGALAEAILRLRRDAALRERLGRAGRQRVREFFDVRTMIRNYEALYDWQWQQS